MCARKRKSIRTDVRNELDWSPFGAGAKHLSVHCTHIGHSTWTLKWIYTHKWRENSLAQGGIRMAWMRSRSPWHSFNSIEFNLPVWPEIMEYVVRTVILNSQSQNWFTDTCAAATYGENTENTFQSPWLHDPCMNAANEERRIGSRRTYKAVKKPAHLQRISPRRSAANAIYACQHRVPAQRYFYVETEGKNEKLNCIIKRFNIPRKTHNVDSFN